MLSTFRVCLVLPGSTVEAAINFIVEVGVAVAVAVAVAVVVPINSSKEAVSRVCLGSPGSASNCAKQGAECEPAIGVSSAHVSIHNEVEQTALFPVVAGLPALPTCCRKEPPASSKSVVRE